ncbi:gppA [Symbiodinium necroappetens]|uniref:GppA protein n=1 Tax=Symbiodinium necroappetens TaxID=1628268 RepID=A0A813AD68_9DINO|nr:gppA [Symbiodinium necroappetens]
MGKKETLTMKTLIAIGAIATVATAANAQIGRAVSADGLDNFLSETITVAPGYDGNAMLGPAFGSTTWAPGDMFGITSRPAAMDTEFDIPFAMADDSNGSFPGDTAGIIDANDNGRFFGIVDSVNGDNPAGNGTASWSFDITGATGLSVNIDFAAMGDFESSNDLVGFTWSIDGSTPAALFTGSVDEAGALDYTLAGGAVVNLSDPFLINGNVLNNVFQTLSAGIAGSGSTLTIAFDGQFDGGSEAFAFRNIEVVPTPGTAAPALASGAGLSYARATPVPAPGKWIRGLAPDMRAHKAASRILDIRLRAAIETFECAQSNGAEEPDAIRRARVATRRARSALDAFRKLLPRKAARKLRRHLKAMRRLAGEPRALGLERDALLELIHDLSPEASAGAAYASGVLDERRPAALSRLRDAESVDLEDYRKQSIACLKALGSIDSDRTLAKHAKKPVGSARSALADHVSAPLDTLDRLHELRLHIKRLRYTDELFRCCTDAEEFDRLYPAMKAVQKRLGELNDTHELHACVESMAEQLDSNHPIRAALLALASELERRRDEERDRLLAWWNDPDADEPAALREALGLDAGVESPTLEPPSIERCIDRAIETAVIRSQQNGALEEGGYRTLDDEKVMARLGKGIATTGAIAEDSIQLAAETVNRMRHIAEGYNVSCIRAIATAAVRDAHNGDEAVKAIESCAGIRIERISEDYEAKLAYRSVAEAFDINALNTAIVDVGGGSTEIVITVKGVVEHVYSLPLGAVRLTEQFGKLDDPFDQQYFDMRAFVKRTLKENIPRPEVPLHCVFGTGGTFRALGYISVCRQTPGAASDVTPIAVRGHEMQADEIRHILHWVRKTAADQRASSIPGLSPDRADIVPAGILIIDRVMKRLECNRALVHDRGIRDGLLLELLDDLPDVHSDSSSKRQRTPIDSARTFAQKCNYEEQHSEHVATLATRIFDQLVGLSNANGEAWATDESRALLEAAGVLHDIGYLINYSKHHKHAYHLIVHSDLPGYTSRELEIVANIARYHRRSEPKPGHPRFMRLAKPDRELVRRLAGILRIADGLDRTHTQHVKDVVLELDHPTLTMYAVADEIPSVDVWGAERKSKLFQDAFGFDLRFQWRPTSPEKPAQQIPPRAQHAETP